MYSPKQWRLALQNAKISFKLNIFPLLIRIPLHRRQIEIASYLGPNKANFSQFVKVINFFEQTECQKWTIFNLVTLIFILFGVPQMFEWYIYYMNISDEESNSEISGTFHLCNFEIRLSLVFPDIWASFKFHTGVPCPLQAEGRLKWRGMVKL